MSLFLISLLAGVLTVLAPCVLPVLPVIIGGSLGEEKRRAAPFIIIASLAVSIVIFTFLLRVSTAFIVIPQAFWTTLSGAILVGFGIIMVFPVVWEKLMLSLKIGRGSNQLLAQGMKKKSIAGDVLMGFALGPIFSTCSPTYAVILATVLPQSFALGFIYLLAYVFGLSAVLILIALIGQRFVEKLHLLSDPRGRFKRGLGVLFLLVGVFVLFGVDKKIESKLLDLNIFDVTKIENRLLESNK